MTTLVGIDSKKTAMIIYHHMNNYVALALSDLGADPIVKFEFLGHLMEYREAGDTMQMGNAVDKQVRMHERYVYIQLVHESCFE